MKTRLYDTTAQQFTGPEREGSLTIDGSPAVLPQHIVELTIVRETLRPLAANERATETETLDLQARTFTYGWMIETVAPSVPWSVTRRQLFLWLLSTHGVTRAQLRAMLTTEAALIEFDEAQEFRREHPLVAQLAGALGMTAADVDAGFIAAAQL